MIFRDVRSLKGHRKASVSKDTRSWLSDDVAVVVGQGCRLSSYDLTVTCDNALNIILSFWLKSASNI